MYNQLGYKIERVGFMKKLQKLWVDGMADKNRLNILSMLEHDPDSRVLDLGCDDGSWTVEISKKIGTNKMYGVELDKNRAKMAELKKIKVTGFDLNYKFSYQDNYFDVIHCNQVIEHLYDTDNFISEIYRVLKPGGYAIISTVNLSGWHNIISLVLGFQPFDLANISVKGNIGNPLSFWNKNTCAEGATSKSWQHIRVFTTYALVQFLKTYGFTRPKVKSSGYYVLPNFFANIDPNHGHYIAVKVFK